MPHPSNPPGNSSDVCRLIEAARRDAEQLERSDPPFAAPPPDSFSGYEIVREVHRGGQGVVYQALEQSSRRTVAIKVMKEGPFAGRGEQARFDREVRILGQLEHPNIVSIHDSGVAAGCHYFVMDYIAGRPLDVYMAGGRRSVKQTLRLFLEICDAINAAHLRGIIHRDIKPSNIRIDADGKPHVLDFGLAKVALGAAACSPAALGGRSEDRLGAPSLPGLGDGSAASAGAPSLPGMGDGPAGSAGVPPASGSVGVSPAEASRMTQAGQFVGSLPWSSPEQAEGAIDKIDVRSDVYSLGVVLYQMLTSQFPYEVVGNMRDVVERILHAAPIRPSLALWHLWHRRPAGETSSLRLRLLRFVPSWLRASVPSSGIDDEVETIVLKCLQKDRERRYQSAGDLARDVQRFLSGEPIEAKRDSPGYVLKKQLRKHKLPVAFSAGILVLIVASSIISLTLWRRSETHRRQTEAQRMLAEQNAEQARHEATKAEAVTQFLQRMLAAVDPQESRGDRDVTVLEVLDKAARDIDDGSLGDQPEVEAAVRTTIGNTLTALGRYSEAKPHLTRALAIRRTTLGNEHPDVARTMRDLAGVMSAAGNYAAAEKLLREALPIAGRASGDRSKPAAEISRALAMALKEQAKLDEAEDAVRTALEIYREQPSTPAEIGETLHSLARLLNQKEDYEAAEQVAREALPLLRDTYGDDHPAVMAAVNTLAVVLYQRGRYDEAERWYRKAIEIERELFGNQHPSLATGLNNLAALLFMKGAYHEAEELYRETLAIQRRALGENHPSVGQTLSNMAQLLFAKGDYAGAESQAREAVTVTREALGDDHPNVGITLGVLGQALHRLARFAESEKTYREALAIQRAAWGEGTPVAVTLGDLAQVLADRGEYHEAVRVAREGLEINRAVHGPLHVQVADSLNTLGATYFRGGNLAAAETLLRQALEIRRKVWGAEHPDVANSLSNLAWLLNESAKHDQAIALQRQALSIQRKLHGPEHPSVAMSLTKLGVYHFAQGDYDEAEPYYDESLAMLRKLLGDDHPEVANVLGNLALLHRGKGDLARAETVARKALTLRQRILPEHNEGIAVSHEFLATVLIESGEFGEAERHARACLAIREKTMPRHWLRHSAAARLAEALTRQGRFDEAEPMLLNAIQEIKPPAVSQRKLEAVRQIIKLYEAWGRADQAVPWRAKLEAMETQAETPEAPAEVDGFDK